jgi:hypothetical protein
MGLNWLEMSLFGDKEGKSGQFEIALGVRLTEHEQCPDNGHV